MSRLEPAAFVAMLAARRPILAPVLLLTAHPDDEVLWASLALRLGRRLLLAHATDGAPLDGFDARKAGCASPAAYGRLRRRELVRALSSLQAAPRRLGPFASDGCASGGALASRLRRFARGALLVTHAREGGHTDHDACADAAETLGRPWVAFAAYGPGFVPTQLGVRIALSAPEEAAKRRALARYASQASVIAGFPQSAEQYAPC